MNGFFDLSKLNLALNLIYSKHSNPNCNGSKRDKVVVKTTCIKSVKFKIIKTRTGCQYV